MDFKPEILQRFFNGRYSRKDYLWIKSMFTDPKNKRLLKETLENHWMSFNNEELSHSEIDNLLQRIQLKIKTEESTKTRKLLPYLRNIAAILVVQILLTFMAFYLYQQYHKPNQIAETNNSYAEIQCPMGARVKFDLPDGTSGYLNSGSKLKYAVQFANNRNVELTGEAWFDVKHDTIHPFTVKTTKLDVEVLGTHFDIIAYDGDNMEEIILNRGSVKVSEKTGNTLSILKPDQCLILDKKKMTYCQSNTDASQYLGWTEGKLVFRNESMEQVAKRLGRWYNIDIEIKNKEQLNHYSFRATFMDEPLEEVLKILAMTSPISYRIIDRKKDSNNVYAKKKVELYFDKKRKNAF
jgi:ferric-dicitrate binding protein FerR (iron transport regulator)